MTHYLQSLIKAFQRLSMKTAMLFIATMMFMPQMMQAYNYPWEDYSNSYPFWTKLHYEANNGNPYIEWETVLWDDCGDDEGFFKEESRGKGLGLYMKVGSDKEFFCGYLACDEYGWSRELYRDGKRVGDSTSVSWGYGGTWVFRYYRETSFKDGKYDHGIHTIKPRWYIPFEYRNSKITIHLSGYWMKWNQKSIDGKDRHNANETATIECPYEFKVRNINWKENYSVASDGTVTIKYSFDKTACNTDGHTHICTYIEGKYNSTIGQKDPASNYNDGSYTFKLSDIGKDFRSTKFGIQPRHEFTHDKDKDANNGKKNFQMSANKMDFLPLPKATITNAAFSQTNESVTIKWTADNQNYGDGRWVIYRDGKKIGVVSQGTTTFTDTGFDWDKEVGYVIYYVMNKWSDTDKIDILKSDEYKVNTTRKVSIRGSNAECKSDRIVLTWKCDGLPKKFGHKFEIYVDNKSICTVAPSSDNQTDFQWEHRTTNQHNDPQNYTDGNISYTEQPLNATNPHNYKIMSVVDKVVRDSVSWDKLNIGTGTTFYSIDASKNVYAGQVKLSWHVNRQGTNVEQKYSIYKRRAERNTEEWTLLDEFSSREDYITCTDNNALPGVCGEYRVRLEEKSGDGTQFASEATDIGFAQASATITGRISYGTSGMAVVGANVEVKPINEGKNSKRDHSLRITSSSGEARWNYPSQEYAQKTFGDSAAQWTVQMWVKPDSLKQQRILKIGNNFSFTMQPSGNSYCWIGSGYPFGPNYTANEYQHLTIAKDKDSLRIWLINAKGDIQYSKRGWPSDFHISDMGHLLIGGSDFTGYIDEFRLWTRALTKDEILENYDHLLVGDEENLELYWTFDEGLREQCFDYSRDGTVCHNHHGKISYNTESSNYVPDQLALRARTDSVGNYIIRGVPFEGEGTTYAVIPTLGIHTFNPSQQLRYVSANALVHNNTDFDDVSSFPVSGTVYYAGTNYPVEGCNFYVDGQVCSKDGELIESNAYGEYNISVPIGSHFIQVKKQGHEFVNLGRFPTDKPYHNFDREVENLNFFDSTLVNFTGRVAGGDIEGDKPVGFGLSKNNIGMATLTLMPRNIENTSYLINAVLPTDGTVIQFKPNSNKVIVASAKPDTIKSESWRGYGTMDECQKFYIRTDPETGEFSAMLPPLDYLVSKIHVESSSDLDSKILKNPIAVDLTNPQVTNQDSTQGNDGVAQYYEYHTLLRQTYHSQPVFTVTQDGNDSGAFGIKSYEIEDGFGKLKIDSIYTADETGHVTYKFKVPQFEDGVPLFEMEDIYTFDIYGYEEYINKDGVQPDTSRVPLADVVVTINNALSADQSVYGEGNTDNAPAGSVYDLKGNQLTLDSYGHATYEWMAGLPNISYPYTRSMDISYEVDGVEHEWSGSPLTGIILGDLPTGNNFVTAGPDHVDMILRDPPGSQSFATWEKGSINSFYEVKGNAYEGEEYVGVCAHNGLTIEVNTGASPMTMTIKNSAVIDGELGVQLKFDRWNAKTVRLTTTATKAISTSNLPEYDGAEGDVFIGEATNLIFGKSRQVGLFRDPSNPSKAVVDLKDALSVSSRFKTAFTYSQHYIVHDLLPNLTKMRNAQLKEVADITSYQYNGKVPEYITTLHPEDPNFGRPNTYKWLHPDEYIGSDTVLYFNNQIDAWKMYLAQNEEDKIIAYTNRENNDVDHTNYSFDAGSSVSISKTIESSHGSHYEFTYKSGFAFSATVGHLWNDFGVEFKTHDVNIWGTKRETDNETTGTATFSYTLKDDDPDDAITVDVYDFKREVMTYKDWKEAHPKDTTYDSYIKNVDEDTVIVITSGLGHYASPIFRTRGGQTSNPYEGKAVVQYDNQNKGQVIMEATMQVEVPKIEAVPARRVNIPSGTAANFDLKLMNASEVDADCPFRLFIDDATNPDGAQLLIDGLPLTDGRIFRVPAGQTIYKSLQIKQSNLGILNYDSIGIILASVGQSDPMSKMPVIADTTYVSVHFVPSSSPVTLEVNTNIINTHTDTVLVLTMKDFDRNFYNLKAFRIQYKQQGGKWTDLHEYVLKGDNLSSNQELLPEGMEVVYRLPMKNALSWPDATYTFRIVSVSKGGSGEIYVYSNEETVIKDTSAPKPLGQAQPSDGILDIGDEVSITFNMPILNGALTRDNFLVTGVLNGSPVEHHTALRLFKPASGSNQPVAATEANINLSGKDFSLDAWFNIQSDGLLLSHGVDKQKMVIATDERSHLVISFGDTVYTSTDTVPRNQWVFFTLSHQVVEVDSVGRMSVSIAYDDVIKMIFDYKSIPHYSGNGPISVGGGATAAIHELLLWDETRDIATALQQRSVTKVPSTRHLIGYWKMNEGEGKTIRDYARNRHMTMPVESWYINNVNQAVALDGTQHITIYTAEVIPLPDDDYAMELWMQGGTQADTAQLMQMGEVSLWLDKNGKLHLQSNNDVQKVNDQNLNDGVWHHVMLNVRRIGTAAVYIDGMRALTVSADKIGSFASEALIVGARRTFVDETDSTVAYYIYDRHFKGSIDEIRLWKTTISSDLLASKRKMRLNGDEPGLSLYYPFEKKSLDANSQIVTSGTLEEMSVNEKGNHNGVPATINGQTVTYVNNAPALKEKPTETNVAFAFTASDTKIVIDVKETPAKIDGCTLNFTVKDVRSVNGNNSLPATWSAFIHRNELVWQDDELNIVKKADTTFTVSTVLYNQSGTPQRWSLSELPTSLTASSISGMLDPLEKATITFVCHETAPLGKHERTIYAMGNNGVPTPLTLHLKVTGEVPDWSVNPADYEKSMNVITQLDFFGHISDDEDDIVAAFINDTCRGVVKSEYKERYDGYYQTLTIYGKPEDQGKQVTFQAYRASTGVYYTLVTPSKKIYYNPLSIIGRYDEPVMLTVNDQIVQRTKLKKGWNWISFLTEAQNMDPKEVFKSIADSVEAIKGHQDKGQGIDVGFLLRTDTGWIGTLGTLLCRRSYMVKMKEDCELQLVGKAVNPATHTVRIHKNWGWPGYYGLHRITLANAFAGADPQNGDMVRTHQAAAYYDDFEWVGSLQSLEPGQGYAYYSVDPTDKWFSYPSSAVAAAPRRAPSVMDADGNNDNPTYTGLFAPDNEYGYPYNMILVGQVLYENAPAANAEIAFFNGDECRSVGYTDAKGGLMMLVAGEEDADLTCKLVFNDQVYETEETLHYVTDAIVGTPAAPHLIRFGELEGIDQIVNGQSSNRKFFKDGILYIIRNGKIYTATGIEIK